MSLAAVSAAAGAPLVGAAPPRVELGSHGVRSTRTAARFDPRLGFDAWRKLGAKFGAYANATPWWLGDWLAFGQLKYGHRYKDAIAATGLDYQTLRNYAMVARRFDVSRRRDNLSFQHHAELCALSDDEQDLWLERAAAEGWPRKELRRQRQQSGRPAVRSQVFRLDVEVDRAERWRDAARRCGRDCEEWIVQVLDEAASQVSATAVAPRRSAAR